MYLFIAGASFGTLLWRTPSRVCWTQQEDFHWFHWHLDQAQNNKAWLCLTDYIHEMPRNELSLFVFGQNVSPAPSRFVKQMAEHSLWGRALPPHWPWLGSHSPSSRACREAAKIDKNESLQRLYCNRALTYILFGFSCCRIFSSSGDFFAGVRVFIKVHNITWEYRVQQFLLFLMWPKLYISTL